MPNILTPNLRHKNIDNFISTIANESVYFAFSNPISWTNENSPDTPVNTDGIYSDVFSDMLYAKKVNPANVTRVVRNYGWTSGSRYQQYDSNTDILELTRIRTYVPATATASLSGGKVASPLTITNPGTEYITAPSVSFVIPSPDTAKTNISAIATILNGSVVSVTVVDNETGRTATPQVVIAPPKPSISSSVFELRPYYVITDEYKVYKCLGNASGALSTIKPSSTDTSNLTPSPLADGYIWKYMFTISTNDIERFYTTSWVPIKTLKANDGSNGWTVQTNALTGSFPFHGADPEKELNATNLMIKVRVTGNEGGSIVDTNDYRQISVILDPVFAGSYYTVGSTGLNISNQMGLNSSHDISNSTATYYPTPGKNVIILDGPGKGQVRSISSASGRNLTLSNNWDYLPDTTSHYGIVSNSSVVNQTTILSLGTVTNGPFLRDSTVTQANTSATGKVVMHDTSASPQLLYLTSITGIFNGTDSISSGGISSTISAVSTPTLYYSGATGPIVGDVLYIENRKPITRYPDQIEDIKVIIQY